MDVPVHKTSVDHLPAAPPILDIRILGGFRIFIDVNHNITPAAA